MMINRKPEKVFRYGSVSSAVWLNQTNHGEFYSVTLSCSYKDRDDQWCDSNSFTLKEMPQAIRALQRAMEYIEQRTDAMQD